MVGITSFTGLGVVCVEEGMVGGGGLHACYPVPEWGGLVVVSDRRHDWIFRVALIEDRMVEEGRCDGV